MNKHIVYVVCGFVAAGGALGTVLIACSGISTDQACTDSAHAQCTTIQTCEPETMQAVYGTEPMCETRVKLNCMNGLAAPSTGNSASKTESCATAYGSWACGDYLSHNNIPAACAQATGSVANGAACEFPGQCQSGFCAIVPGNACGSCAAAPNAGDDCSQLTTCGPTLDCTLDTQKCATYAQANGTCGAGQPCAPGLCCVASGGIGTPGTCQTAGSQVGTTCDGTLKTGPNCNGSLGFYCDGLTKQCAQLTFTSSGSCGYQVDAGTNTACTSGACENGQCMPRATDNGACVLSDAGGANSTFDCVPPARCVGGICQVETAANCH
jgi:hypothetical protein